MYLTCRVIYYSCHLSFIVLHVSYTVKSWGCFNSSISWPLMASLYYSLKGLAVLNWIWGEYNHLNKWHQLKHSCVSLSLTNRGCRGLMFVLNYTAHFLCRILNYQPRKIYIHVKYIYYTTNQVNFVIYVSSII